MALEPARHWGRRQAWVWPAAEALSGRLATLTEGLAWQQ
jgi:hypothetical protein